MTPMERRLVDALELLVRVARRELAAHAERACVLGSKGRPRLGTMNPPERAYYYALRDQIADAEAAIAAAKAPRRT